MIQAEVNGVSLNLLVDTGMSGAMFALSVATARAVGLASLTQAHSAGVGGGGRVAGERVTLPRLRAAGLLASDYFQDAVLSFDFFNMTLSVD